MATADDKIILGSGKLYIDEFIGDVIPTDVLLEVPEKLLGLIEGGCSLEYKPKFVTVTDDLGLVSKTILTEEAVKLSSGIMTWNGQKLAKICSTSSVEELAGKRTVTIGGLNNQNGKKYVIRFIHADPTDGDIRVTIVGCNQSGFKMAFVKDKATVVDAEFIAEPFDSTGALILYSEDIPIV